MKRMVLPVLVVLVALWAIPAAAQTTQPSYTVQQGDTGWELARQYYDNPTIWQRIVDMNPALQQPGRVFEKDGKIILLLKPGEQLFGLDSLNVAPPKAVSLDQLVKPAEAPKQADTSATMQMGNFPWWIVALLLAAIVGGLTWFGISRSRQNRRQLLLREQTEVRERELRRDPVTSGPAMVPGGIPATDTERLQNFFDEQATSRFAQRNPTVDRATIRATRVGPIEEGTISGEGLVGYLGGEFRPRRIDTPIRAYQARYRFPDGTEEVLQCLQACMNPVQYGGDTYRGFTFTPTQAVVPVPEPERPSPVPAPHPAMAVRRIREEAGEEGRSTLTIGDRVITIDRGAHLAIDEATGNVTISGTVFEMTVKRKEQPAAKADETPLATGTDAK